MKEKPYIIDLVPRLRYNPEYGDFKVCTCGHPYHRHFDSYNHMEAVGCKYCVCHRFKQKQPVFYITKKNLDGIFEYIKDCGIIPHPYYTFTWGKFRTKEELFAVIDSLPVDEDGEILVSTVQQRLDEFRTAKLAVNANDQLDYYKKRITFYRQEKKAKCLWIHRNQIMLQ